MDQNRREDLEAIIDIALKGNSGSEVRIMEDIYQVDAMRAFAEICEEDLGFPGMRLDLFYPDYDPKKDD